MCPEPSVLEFPLPRGELSTEVLNRLPDIVVFPELVKIEPYCVAVDLSYAEIGVGVVDILLETSDECHVRTI